MIAEVHQIKLPTGASGAPSEGANNLAEEAAKAPGSVQLLTLMDTSTGDGLVIHLWNDQAAYEAFAARRKELTADAEGSGSRIDPARLYEVSFNS
jgi:heme-degrading monooxygenase HmoA